MTCQHWDNLQNQQRLLACRSLFEKTVSVQTKENPECKMEKKISYRKFLSERGTCTCMHNCPCDQKYRKEHEGRHYFTHQVRCLLVYLYLEVRQGQEILRAYLSKGLGDTCMKCQSWIFLREYSKPSLCCPRRDQITLYRQKTSTDSIPEVKINIQKSRV